MTIKVLIEKIEEINCKFSDDAELSHTKIDDLLLQYINNPKVTELFKKLPKYCA